MLHVFKFGGASVKDAPAVRNVSTILRSFIDKKDKLVIVVSAMGKTTNHLEDIFKAAKSKPKHEKNDEFEQILKQIKDYHYALADELFDGEREKIVYKILQKYIFQLSATLKDDEPNWDKHYDQVICFGELMSSAIVSEYLKMQHEDKCLWVDARRFVQTNERWREGQIDWEWSEQLIRAELLPMLEQRFVLTQGFIGGTIGGKTTTLGREGSDFTAAVFAYCLQADGVTIWKDVSGILNADPKRIKNTRLFEQISYSDAAEMTYYGVTVIHPKTIRPLAAKGIPLYVRSFLNADVEGTRIGNFDTQPSIPSIIVKANQHMLVFKAKDLAAINERNQLAYIHSELNRYTIKINLLQVSATSFSVCTDNDERKLASLKESLSTDFELSVLDNLELITIKNYDTETLKNFTGLGNALVAQRSEDIFQVVVRK